ncbi:MAG TPA: hypothetical protein VKM55_08715 [Candidatus Lokiarchaeia archaeon]|nr:hypothetical protein [Candidatus Lokiarchaeia archaeon]
MASPEYAKTIVRKWFKEFAKSALFKELPARYQQDAKQIILLFAECMAGYFEDPPLSWNGDDAFDCVVHLIPEKMIVEKEYFTALAPVLLAFFEFLGIDTIEKTWSLELIKAIRGKDKEILKNAKCTLEEPKQNKPTSKKGSKSPLSNANENVLVKPDSTPDFIESSLRDFHDKVAKMFPDDQNLNEKIDLLDGLVCDVFSNMLVEIEGCGDRDTANNKLRSMTEKELYDKLDNLLYHAIVRKFYDRHIT